MRLALLAACGLASLTLAVRADPIGLLAPDDPGFHSGWRPPPAPTADVKSYAPVEAKDWLERSGDKGPGGQGMSGMKGMGGMKGMPGMDQ